MGNLILFVAIHAPILICLTAFASEICLPIPIGFLFLQIGALVALGKFNVGWGLVMPVAGTVLADICLYFIGRRWGAGCLRLAYRFSLEPEALSQRRERLFGRFGLGFLVLSKFLPMSMVPPVMAGMDRISLFRFLSYSAAGTVLWVFFYTGLGYLFYRQIDSIVHIASHATGALAVVGGALLTVYIGIQQVRRRRILRLRREKRVDPEELTAGMDAGGTIALLDVRSRGAIEHLLPDPGLPLP